MNILTKIAKLFCLGMLYASLTLTANAQVSSLLNGFPTNDASEGKVLAASEGLSSLGAPPASGTVFNVHIRIPITTATLNIEIFDPDLYSDAVTPGYWDFPALSFTPGLADYDDATRFELYPDVNVSGNTTTGLIASLLADSSMDNQWIDFFNGSPISVDPNDPAACEQGVDAKFCFYHLVARWVDATPPHNPKLNATTFGGNVLNGFIVASNGLPFLAEGSTIGIIGMTEESPSFPVPATNYDGTISLRALVESTQECALDIYDGDADRAGTANAANYPDESDDPNTPADGIATGFFPFPLSADTLEEGIIPGNPADNSQNRPDRSIGVPIFYTVDPEPPTAAYGVDCCVNDNPSGDKEWELYRIASSAPGCPDVTDPNYDPDDLTSTGGVNGPAPAAAPDEVVDIIAPGFHRITLGGMDENNLNFLNVSADIFAGDAFDYGDAPNRYGTTLVNNGPSHDVDARLTMGVEIDAEFDGAPTNTATGDDVDLLDDEDGVSNFNPLSTDLAGGNYSVEIAVRSELDAGDVATLFGWIDFDIDGTFEASESASVQVNPGDTTANLVFVVPANIIAGDTYARFRLTSDPSISTITPGGGATDGEVEDYALTIEPGNECIPCKGMKKITFQMTDWDDSGSVQRDPNEIVRVRVGDLTGRFSGSDFSAPILFEDQVVNGGMINIVVPDEHLGKPLTISVEGNHHSIEYGKAKFYPDCDLNLDTTSGNGYITFKVIILEKNSDDICECVPDPESGEGCECVPDPESGIMCPPPPPSGGQGCTPGYWKQSHHFDSWIGYNPNDRFRDAFGKGSRMSLIYNLSKGGGGGIAFRRHATAALLNAANPDVNYFQTVDQVIDTVLQTYNDIWHAPRNQRKAIWNAAKDIFEQQNELGCPIN